MSLARWIEPSIPSFLIVRLVSTCRRCQEVVPMRDSGVVYV